MQNRANRGGIKFNLNNQFSTRKRWFKTTDGKYRKSNFRETYKNVNSPRVTTNDAKNTRRGFKSSLGERNFIYSSSKKKQHFNKRYFQRKVFLRTPKRRPKPVINQRKASIESPHRSSVSSTIEEQHLNPVFFSQM